MQFLVPLALVLAQTLPQREAPLSPSADFAGARPIGWPGQSTIWSDSFGTPATDWVNGVIELRNSDVLAVGFLNRSAATHPPSWDLVARRYTASGRLLWSRRIGGPGVDAGWGAVETADGRIAIVGPSDSAGAGESDVWLVVLDSRGVTVSEHRYGGAAEDSATGIALAHDGGFILTGWTQSAGAGGRDVLLIRTDDQGRELWRRTSGGPEADRGFYVATVEDGYVVAGVTGQPEAYDMLLVKFDESGEVLWQRSVGGSGNDPVHGLTILANGNIRLVGYTRSWDARDYDLIALTFSPDGNRLGQSILSGPGEDRAQFSATAPDGSTWVTGYTRRSADTDWDILLARIGPGGAFEPWMARIGTAASDNGTAIAIARNGDLLVGGHSATPSDGAEPPDGFIMRLAPGLLDRDDADIRLLPGPAPAEG
jgi:hypothetical protein